MANKIITDLESIVENKSDIKTYRDNKSWQVVNYETSDFRGKMLVSHELCNSKSITLDLKVKGLYKISFGFINYPTDINNYTAFKLSSDDSFQVLSLDLYQSTVVDGYNYWSKHYWIEECFWKIADLTNEKLIIKKPECIKNALSQICFIKLEEVSDFDTKVLEENRNVMYHFDTDDNYLFCKNDSPLEYTSIVESYKNGSGDIILQETYFEDYEPILENKGEVMSSRENVNDQLERYILNHDEINKERIKKAHKYGFKIYAATRLEMGNFTAPLESKFLCRKFVEDNKDLGIIARDGRKSSILSYAFKRVREWEINRIMKSVERGYDGVSIFFNRGVFVGFEEPVIELFNKRYNNIDPFSLLLDDDRLNECMGYFVTLFLKELRERLDNYSKSNGLERIKINTVVCYSLRDSKRLGCNIVEWLKNGLVDSVSQGLMSSYEYLDGCMSDDNSSIDINKYQLMNKKHAIFRREFHDKLEVILSGAKELYAITKKYKVDFYGALPWQNKDPKTFVLYAKELYKIGIEKLFVWNASHISKYTPKLEVVKKLGDKDWVCSINIDDIGNKKLHRVFSIDDVDISTYNPNWLG